MKIQFKRTTAHSDDTTTQNAVTTAVLNNIRDGISNEIALSEIYETARINQLIKTFIHKDIESLETNPIKLNTEYIQPNMGQQMFSSGTRSYRYSIEYELVSQVYECIGLLENRTFILVEPKTNRIFEVKIEESQMIEVYLVKE